ncbi:MAG TPA: DUF1302 domain-containing protein [Azospirillum sp.]|nr:DUF1302 domain-containing protein [Azospirillum sp.]
MKRVLCSGSSLRASLLAAVAAMILPAGASAAELAVGDGWAVRVDSELTTGLQIRTQNRDCRIVARDNGGCAALTSQLLDLGYPGAVPDFNYLQFDNGNLNFNRGDIVSWAVKGTHDLSIKGPDDWSALVRANWVSDLAAPNNARFGLHDGARDVTQFEATLLDAWVSKGFTWFDRSAKIRVGNQIVSWGEDIFIPGGINVINGIDLRKFHTPGTALKEVFRPAPMVYLNSRVTENLSAEAYYQFMWNGFRFDPVGTYFSTVDVIGPGARSAFIPSVFAGPGGGDEHVGGPSIPKLSDNRPGNQGQFGTALRYKLGDADLGLYYVRYHDKLPQISFTGDADGLPNGFFLDYGRNRDLVGASGSYPLATSFGDLILGGELSWRPRDTVGIDPTVAAPGHPFALPANGVGRGFVTEQKWQGHLTANYLFSPDSPLGRFQEALGATDGYILAEAAFAHYPGLSTDGSIPYLLPNYSLPDRFSMGYVIEVGMTYPHIFNTPINMTPYVNFAHDVKGTSPNAMPFVEGRKSMALNLAFNYLGKMKANVVYALFWGGGDNNLLRDRDFVGMSFTYSF